MNIELQTAMTPAILAIWEMRHNSLKVSLQLMGESEKCVRNSEQRRTEFPTWQIINFWICFGADAFSGIRSKVKNVSLSLYSLFDTG